MAKCLLLLPLLAFASVKFEFPEAAVWISVADIKRIRSNVAQGAEPWASAATRLMGDKSLPRNFSPRPRANVCCGGPPPCDGGFDLEQDSMAAYLSMLRWIVSNDTTHLDVAERVIDGWSAKLKRFSNTGPMLTAGIAGSHLAQASELLAYARGGVAE